MKTLAKFSLAIFTICLITFSASAQNWGVGIRAGDPTGLSIKKYDDDNAWELNIGRANYWTYKYDYNYYFYHDSRLKNYKYLGWYDHSGMDIQLRKLWSKPFPDVANLNWYYGAGAQLFTNSFYYRYVDGNGFITNEKYTSMDIGIDGVLGLEYFFDDLPISASLDVNATMLLIDRPFYLFGQSGLGIRYTF